MKLGKFIERLQQWEEHYGSDAELYIDYESEVEIDACVFDDEDIPSDEWETAIFVVTPCYHSKVEWINYPSDEEIERMAQDSEKSLDEKVHDSLMKEYYQKVKL
jgi:hypothetical protein